MIDGLINGNDLREDIAKIITDIHVNGPVKPALLERLAYYKKFHPEVLADYEGRILNVMGLFYKTLSSSSSLLEEVYGIFNRSIEEDFGVNFTPVQASAYRSITEKRYFSFSAPTSSGKSFLFRELVKNFTGDMVIVVPSRALIAEYYQEIISFVDKNTLVLQFIDNININKIERRIFIITPERGVELFNKVNNFDIRLFLFDEAQISEEEIRGMRFDVFVRRVDKVLPNAKKVFAHPFVLNPEAQLKKHNFYKNSDAYSYKQQSVGKIFLGHATDGFSYFSPHGDATERINAADIVEETLKNGGTLLAYVSKDMIYSNRLLDVFSNYIALCKNVENDDAKKIIDKLREFIGASKKGKEKFSLMIALMERGIVIHHGSMPLKSRFLVEEFIRKGFAKICFSTSTLAQGINMPFNIVWIRNFRNMDILTLKNLIGRAGRTSSNSNEFDYGYTIIENENISTFVSRYADEYTMAETSVIDAPPTDITLDYQDIADAVATDSFDDDFNMPEVQIERIKNENLYSSIDYVLNALFVEGEILDAQHYYALGKTARNKLKNELRIIFCAHLRQKDLTKAEKSVVSAAIPILLWKIRNKSFSEIVSMRYRHLSKKDERDEIEKDFISGKTSEKDRDRRLSDLKVGYSPIGGIIPNKRLTGASLFDEECSVRDISYDIIVYDTYDYIDKVISISMADPLCAAFKLHYEATSDKRALTLVNYIMFGTDDPKEIWLLRYGFSSDDFHWLNNVVDRVDNGQIYFNDTVTTLHEDRYAMIERYL